MTQVSFPGPWWPSCCILFFFSAHVSIECSRWAVVIALCPSSIHKPLGQSWWNLEGIFLGWNYKNRSKNGIPPITLVAMATKMKKMENLWKSSLKPEGIEFWCLVCSISEWTSTKQSLFKWCPLGQSSICLGGGGGVSQVWT